jgi:hypothetical protein
MMEFLRFYLFSTKKTISKYKKKDDSINSKSMASYATSILNDNINHEINDPHHAIPIINIINIEHYDL